jgi:putative ABC transport system permease protein
MKLAGIAFRNIRRNRRRSLLSGSAIAVAAMFIAFMFSVINGMVEDYRSNVVRYLTGHVRIRNTQYDANEQLNPLHLSVPDYQRVVSELESRAGVEAVVPRIQFAAAIYRDQDTYNGLGLGVDFARERNVMRIDQSLTEGRLPQMGERELLLSAGLAKELEVGVGDRLTLLSTNKYLGLSGMTFAITGIARFPVTAFNQSFFLVPVDTAGRFLKMSGEATEILVLLSDPSRGAAFSQETNRLLQQLGLQELRARPWEGIGNWFSLMRLLDVSYNFVALFFFILGSTVIATTTMMVIYERMREIGTVAAMGMTPGEIVRLFFLEALYIAAIAAFVGVVIGVAITLPLSRHGVDLSGPMQGISIEVNPVIRPVLNWRSTIFVFLYSVGIAALASFIPSRRAARIEPVEALRSV